MGFLVVRTRNPREGTDIMPRPKKVLPEYRSHVSGQTRVMNEKKRFSEMIGAMCVLFDKEISETLVRVFWLRNSSARVGRTRYQ